MEVKRPKLDESIDVDEAYEQAASAICELEIDESVPAWLKDAFIGVAVCAASEAAKAAKRLAIDGTLPQRYADYEAAHINADRPYSVLVLLVTEYFATGRIAGGITRQDIKHYDPNLIAELEYHEGLYGELPVELHIPRDQHDTMRFEASGRKTNSSPSLRKP